MAAKVEVTILRQAGGWLQSLPHYRMHVEAWVNSAFVSVNFSLRQHSALAIVLTDDAAMQTLNHMYRGKNKPTNVLSFSGKGEELGDIVLAYQTVKSEAAAQKKTFKAHTAHLVVHGCLHLVGYDHENEKEARRMEACEIAILARLGFANPYEYRK